MDFAVPRRPEIAIPPNVGSIPPKSSADLIFSCPITAASGNVWRMVLSSFSTFMSCSICITSFMRCSSSDSDASSATAARTTRRGVARARAARAPAREVFVWHTRDAGRAVAGVRASMALRFDQATHVCVYVRQRARSRASRSATRDDDDDDDARRWVGRLDKIDALGEGEMYSSRIISTFMSM